MFIHDPVYGKRISRNKAYIAIVYCGGVCYVCCPQCQAAFEREPNQYVRATKVTLGTSRK